MRRERNGIPRTESKAVGRISFAVKDGGFSRHVAVDDTKFLGAGRPCYIMYGALLVYFNVNVYFKIVPVQLLNLPSVILESKPVVVSKNIVDSP